MQYLLQESLPDFTKATILVVGDIMLDRYWFGDVGRISPEAPVPIVSVCGIDHRPGGAGNVALNIAALHAQVILIGVTGDDEAATILENQLASAKVTLALCKIPHLSTNIKLRVISRSQQLIRLDFEEKSIEMDRDVLFEHYKTYLPKADLVILSDYHKGCLRDPQPFIQLARAAQIPVLVDPKGNDFHRYHHANMITPNFKEFENEVGHCDSEHMILQKGRELLSRCHIDSLLITRSEQGMTLMDQTVDFHLPAYAREVLDVTGAGDTVISVLGACVASKMALPAASALANLAASITVGKLGAATVSVPELQVALISKTIFTSGIVNEEQLLHAVQAARAQGKRIVFTNGCYDVLHAGHVLCLQMAKTLGDYLIVAVNSDESVRQLKGEHRPINHLAHRMTVLAGLGVVDWVVPFDDDTPERLLTLLKPDVLAKGSEYQLSEVVGADIVHSYGGEVRLLKREVNLSSTDIIDRIRNTATQVLV